MTVSSTEARNEYVSAAAQTVFNFTFKIFITSDLAVYVTPSGQDSDDTTDLTTDYVVDPGSVGVDVGGFFTFNTPLNAGDKVSIVSDIPLDRTVDYQNNGDFRPDTVNGDNDRQVAQIKQLAESVNKTLVFNQSSQNTSGLTIDNPEALKFLRWRADLLGLENVDVSSIDPDVIANDSLVFGFPTLDSAVISTDTTIIKNGVTLNIAEHTTGSGGGAIWDVVLSSTVTENTYDIVQCTGVPALSLVLRIQKGRLSVDQVGATDSSDSFGAIQAANDRAASEGASVWFPKKVSTVSVQANTPFSITTDWHGDSGIIRNTNLALAVNTVFALIETDNLNISGIQLDGQITTTGSGVANQDQAVPSDANVDDYTQLNGWQVKAASGVRFTSCSAINVFRAGFRADNFSEDLVFDRCFVERSRGAFGDPFIVFDCRNVVLSKCFAKDYTRIGFVIEGAAGVTASDYIRLTDCYAEYAHDNVSTENNCGFWIENGQQVDVENCQAFNTVGGILLSSTAATGKTAANNGELNPISTYNLTNFTADSVKTIVEMDAGIKPANFNLKNINGSISTQDFNGTFEASPTRSGVYVKIAGNVPFTINIDGISCYIPNAGYSTTESYGMLAVQQSAENTVRQVINMTAGNLTFEDPVKVVTDAASGNGKGFFQSIGSLNCEVNLTRCKEVTSTNGYITISSTSFDDGLTLNITQCNPHFIKSSGDCKLINIHNAGSALANLTFRSKVVRIKDTEVDIMTFNTNKLEMYGGSANQLNQTTDSGPTRRDVFKAVGVTFNASLATSACLTFNDVSAYSIRCFFQSCIFFNTDAATNTEEFIKFVSVGEPNGAGNFFDQRAPNYLDLNGTIKSAPKTDFDNDMPFGIAANLA